jgi:hypothetical protein
MNKKDLPEIDRIIDAAITDEAKRLQTASFAAKDRIFFGVLAAGAAKETAKHNFLSASKPARGTIPAAITRERLQWALTTLSFAVATLALVLLVSQLRKADKGGGTIQSAKPPATSAKPQATLYDTTKTVVTERPTVAPPRGAVFQPPPFRVTRFEYDVRANLDSAVTAEFGRNYKIANWNDLKAYCAKHTADSLIAMTKWTLMDTTSAPEGDSTRLHYFINWTGKWTGKGFWNKDSTWHFFATRTDHRVPSWYLANDQIDSNHILLGSWADMKCRVLAEKRDVTH